MLNQIKRLASNRLSGAVLAAGLLAGISVSGQAAAEPADQWVQRTTTEAIAKISKDADIQAGNTRKVGEFVDQMIMPNVDFKRMTSLAVGRPWRSATPEQQKLLMAEFRTLLVRTYANAFLMAKDRTVRMKPFRADAADSDVVVTSELVAPRGQPITMGYRLEKTGEAWRIFDVNVEGIWLVDNYRNQFAQEISNSGIDGLIKSLADKNKAFAG